MARGVSGVAADSPARGDGGGGGLGALGRAALAVLAVLPLGLTAWAAWLDFWARAWGTDPEGAVMGLVTARYFLLLALGTLAGAGLVTGWRGWGVAAWAALGLPLLAALTFVSVPPIGYLGQLLPFILRWGLTFFGAGIALAILVSRRRGRGPVLKVRAVLALAAAAVLAATLWAGGFRAVGTFEHLGRPVPVLRENAGYRPFSPWAAAGPAGEGRAFLVNSRGDLYEVRPGGRPWLARRPALLPVPAPAEVEDALGAGWSLEKPYTFFFLEARGLDRLGLFEVAYELQAFRPESGGGFAGEGLLVKAVLDVDHGRAMEHRALPRGAPRPEAPGWQGAARAGPYTVDVYRNYTIEVKGKDVLTRIHSRHSAVWSWVWAQGRLAMAATEAGELVVVVLPEP